MVRMLNKKQTAISGLLFIAIIGRLCYNNSMDVIREKLKLLPDNSGVYIMLDKYGNIIYVGKARVLKNRVRQYFHNSQIGRAHV